MEANIAGTGEALDAAVVVSESNAETEIDIVDAERKAAELAVLRENVSRAEAGLAKAEAHVEGRRQAVEDAKAELAAAEGN